MFSMAGVSRSSTVIIAYAELCNTIVNINTLF